MIFSLHHAYNDVLYVINATLPEEFSMNVPNIKNIIKNGTSTNNQEIGVHPASHIRFSTQVQNTT